MLLQTGSHGYSLFYHVYRKWDHPDFNELMLHHLVTIFLLVHAYFTNGFAQSVVTTMFHDWGDWVYNVSTFYRDLFMHKYPKLIIFCIIGFPSLFVYMRVVAQGIWYSQVAFHWMIGNTGIYKHPQFNYFGNEIYFVTSKLQFTMLVVLWIMNCYWSMLIGRVVFNKMVKGAWTNDVWGETNKANKISQQKKTEAAKAKVA